MSRIDESTMRSYLRLKSLGYSQREACAELGVPRSSMQNALKQEWNLEEAEIEEGAKILFIDVECAPSALVGFGRFNQHFGQDNVLEEGGWLITACYKWADSDDVVELALTPEQALKRDDSDIVAAIYEAVEEADIVVAQNGDRFDMPLINTRGLLNGFQPMKPVKTVDTLKIAKRLKFNSNRLDSLGSQLGLGRKVSHDGIDLWVRCMKGDMSAINDMLEYNVQDVILLEQVYNKIRGFDNKHPNMAHYHSDNKKRCPVCGSHDIHETGHSAYTPISEFKEMKCNNCGNRSRTRQPINSKEKRASILANIVR